MGSQLGSNPGGQYEDEHGKRYYAKLSKSEAHAKNEVLAGHLYHAAGAPIVQAHLIDIGNGKLGTITEWLHGVKNIDRKDANQRRDAQKHFATHAWLANWDSVGLDYDNQGHVNGKMTTLDPGGSLIFRAQGGPKGDAFGNNVSEWESLRHPSNSQAHSIFGEMKPDDLRKSAARVASVPDHVIRDLVHQHGPGSIDERKALADKLVKRKQDIVRKAT